MAASSNKMGLFISEKSLEVYLNEISTQGMLTADEEVDLAKKIHSGDEEALKKLALDACAVVGVEGWGRVDVFIDENQKIKQ